MSEQGRPLPAVNLSRFAGLLVSEDGAAAAADLVPRMGIPVRLPPRSPSIAVSAALDPKAVESAVRVLNLREGMRAVFGRDLVEVRTTSNERGKMRVVVVLRGKPEARRREVYSSSDDGWEVDVPHVEVDVTGALLTGDMGELRLLAERARR